MPLFHYTLKLYSDPTRLPRLVPAAPGFPLQPCGITAASTAHVPGACQTLSSLPCRGFSPLTVSQGFPTLLWVPFRRRPICLDGSDRLQWKDSKERKLQRSSHAAPAQLRARGFRQCQQITLRWLLLPFLGVSIQVGNLDRMTVMCVWGG